MGQWLFGELGCTSTIMASNYYNISAEEMDAFLIKNGFKKIDLKKNDPNDRTTEIVYGKRVDQDNLQLTLRCYTGIDKSGQSRKCGADAIRIHLFMRKNGRIIKLNGSKKVLRVTTWEKNLQDRLDGWLKLLPSEKCERCGGPMIPRKRKGESSYSFLGCAGWPNCNYTRNIQT